MADWLDELNKCSEKLLLISDRLDRYSRAFYVIGNYNIADNLEKESSEISLISEKINKVSVKVVSDQLKTAQENSANVLHAALAGIEIATKDKKS